MGGFLADPWECLKRHSYRVDESKAELRRYMDGVLADPEYYSHYALTQSRGWPDDDPPNASLSATLIGKIGYEGLAANSTVAIFRVGKHVASSVPLPVDWLLKIGVSLVTTFVDVWRPDVVSLDSTEVLQARPVRGSGWPVIGFASWLSDRVVNPTVSFPKAHLVERYKHGTLISVNPLSPDPVGDAISMSTQAWESGLLHAIPFIQPQDSQSPTVATAGRRMPQ